MKIEKLIPRFVRMMNQNKEIKKIQRLCPWYFKGECMADSGPWGTYPCYVCEYVLKRLKEN